MKRQLTHNELSIPPRTTGVHLNPKHQFPTLRESKDIRCCCFKLHPQTLIIYCATLLPAPYLEHGLVSYPVSGVDVPGHLSQFISPGRRLPLRATPLQLLLLLLLGVRGRTGHRRLQPGSWCGSLRSEGRRGWGRAALPRSVLSVCTDGARASREDWY